MTSNLATLNQVVRKECSFANVEILSHCKSANINGTIGHANRDGNFGEFSKMTIRDRASPLAEAFHLKNCLYTIDDMHTRWRAALLQFSFFFRFAQNPKQHKHCPHSI